MGEADEEVRRDIIRYAKDAQKSIVELENSLGKVPKQLHDSVSEKTKEIWTEFTIALAEAGLKREKGTITLMTPKEALRPAA